MNPTIGPPPAFEVIGLSGIGQVRSGDDLAALLLEASRRCAGGLLGSDVLCVSSKLVSKSLGLWRSDRGSAVRRESRSVVAERQTPAGTTRIVRSAAGPVMAAAGVDASNLGPDAGGVVLVLPRDPDAAAADLRRALGRVAGVRPAVLVTDTAGRPWRHGQTDFALGAAGLAVVDDLRGGTDADGNVLEVTVRAVADELAAAAELVKGKAEGVPAAIVRGLGPVVTADDGPGARSLVRTGLGDWFATGDVESVRAAVGCPPGSDVELAPAGAGSAPADILRRAAAVVSFGRNTSADAMLRAVQVQAVGDRVLLRGDLVPTVRLAERVAVVAAAEGLVTSLGCDERGGTVSVTAASTS